ncbi:MAG: hypothetical protein JNK15_20550 [Planctomycetes bacterium]|nr:hypothetical protein [Planctomycetota bacterium]
MGEPAQGQGERAQRGAALLLALVLTVSLSLLAITVLAGRDMAVAVADHARLRQRAQWAAASGVEWAAAKAMADGLVAATTRFTTDTGDFVGVAVRPLLSPHVVAVGRCDGAEVQLGADLAVMAPAAPSYAFMSLSGTSHFTGKVGVTGSAYFGDALLPLSSLFGTLSMAGDVDLVTVVPVLTNPIVHQSGATRYGVAALTAPVVDVAAFPADDTAGVPVTDYSGTQVLRGLSLAGIVRFSLASGQSVTLQSTTIDGSIVVVTTGTILVQPKLVLLDGAVVNGGTALTGNLAILAPGCSIEGNAAGTKAVGGVVYANKLNQLRDVAFTGMVVTAAGMSGCTGSIDRPAGFEPDTPLGLTWSGQRNCRILWRGER